MGRFFISLSSQRKMVQLKPREGVAHKNAGIQLANTYISSWPKYALQMAKTYIFIWPKSIITYGIHLLEFAVLNLSELRYRNFGLWYCVSGMAVPNYHLIPVAPSGTVWQAP